MRYLRILRKADFEALLERDPHFAKMAQELKALESERKISEATLSKAGTQTGKYKELSSELVKHDRKLAEVYSKYVLVRDAREALVKDLNTRQKALYDEAQDDIKYHAKRVQVTQRKIQDVRQAISSYRSARYAALCKEHINQKANSGPDNKDSE